MSNIYITLLWEKNLYIALIRYVHISHLSSMFLRRSSCGSLDKANCLTIETLSCPVEDSGSCGAYIIRIPCGARNKYMAKGSLWQHIPEFVDGAINHIVNMARALGEQVNGGKPTWPHVIHGHYTDPREVAAHVSSSLNVPMLLQGTHWGQNKFNNCLSREAARGHKCNTQDNEED
ncbi:hypothetical protein Patl1_20396 [Pistacia atlantica]|uniref:Uncharacterized protein n=1 Tax=Pistacia atlantica TaxID=434234 RepID=A0ACC1BNI4_9ROSI|nr:hypothetical protein Patl1_20396 [Pistacia atlantica]